MPVLVMHGTSDSIIPFALVPPEIKLWTTRDGCREAPDVTYLADTVILLRYFEALGRVRRAISVVKKRTGRHEDTIREYRIGGATIKVGEPLVEFQGVLRGVPVLVGSGQNLLEEPGF